MAPVPPTPPVPPAQRKWFGVFRTMTGRLLSVSIFVTVLAFLLGGIALSGAFRDYALTDIDDRLETALDTMVGASEIGPDGVIRFTRPLFDQRFAEPYSGWYWQISEKGSQPFRSRSLWDFELEPDLDDPVFGLVVHEHAGPDGQVLRVVERDIILPEAERVFRYMVAADTQHLRSAIAGFNNILLVSLGLITAAIAVSLLVQLSVALRPLRQIRRDLADVRAGRKQTMGTDYPEDLMPLSDEIDALIKHNTNLLERARTHVGNLAHGVKTPISVIRNELDSDKEINRERVKSQLDEMLTQIDHHLRRARVSGSARGVGVDVAARLNKMVKVVGRLYQERDLVFETDLSEGLFFGGEVQDFDEIAGNLIENAGKWANEKIRVSAHPVKEKNDIPYMDFVVEDDGPGVPESEYSSLFERGRRLDESVPGTGLGLAIVQDIVELYRGRCQVAKSDLGGLKISVRLPAKPSI